MERFLNSGAAANSAGRRRKMPVKPAYTRVMAPVPDRTAGHPVARARGIDANDSGQPGQLCGVISVSL
jgi:hypothetical protein